jgi:3D (Asp-Asp-Asp) domain-containing protein
LSNRASSLIPIPELIGDDDFIPLVNERLLRVDSELGRLDARVDSISTTTTTPAANSENSALSAVCTAAFTGGAGYANVTGLNLTLDRDGVWVITAVLRAVINAGAALMVGQLLVTPVAGAPAALTPNIVLQGAAGLQATVAQTWVYTATNGDQLDVQAVGVNTAIDPVTAGVGYSSTLTAVWVSA